MGKRVANHDLSSMTNLLLHSSKGKKRKGEIEKERKLKEASKGTLTDVFSPEGISR